VEKNEHSEELRDNAGILPPVLVALPCWGPPVFSDCLLIYVAQGESVIVELSKERVCLGPDDVCLLCPDEPHRLGGKGKVVCVAIERATLLCTFIPLVACCPPLLKFFMRCQRAPNCITYMRFSYHEGATARPLAERIFAEFAGKQKSYQTALIGIVAELFVLLARDYYVSAPSEGLLAGGKADLILGFLSENCTTATLESTARHFHCHPNTISSILRENLGKSFSELRRDLRLKRACLFLAQTTLPIIEVASLCGYENMTSFYKAFKGQYGTTPKVFSSRPTAYGSAGLQ